MKDADAYTKKDNVYHWWSHFHVCGNRMENHRMWLMVWYNKFFTPKNILSDYLVSSIHITVRIYN